MKNSRLKAKKILVIRYRFIGDTILTVPFLRNLRSYYPEAQIDVLVGPQSGEVLTGCPYINNLIVYDTTRFHKYDSGIGEKKSFWSYVFSLRKEKYDTAFVLKRSWSSALLALLIGCKNRIGYATEGRQIILTKSVPFDSHMHEVDSTLTVLTAGGIPIKDRYLEGFISSSEHEQVQRYLQNEQKTIQKKVLIHAAAAHPDKLYPLESWAKIVSELHHKHGFVPYFTGAKQDFELYEQVQKLAAVKGINLAGELSLRQSMALYSALDLAICTDSGPAHLAACVGTPTIAVFGPTDPVRWRPYEALNRRLQSSSSAEQAPLIKNEAIFDETLPCRPCNYNKTCIDRPCLNELAPSAIIARALALLQSQSESN
ncbi:MAG: glycosyltransferase family 9 protein [Candidatus Obscuribacterales bacterium]|nr:glycosyltransferase family 9 protein [Candidatus Obscuribacterales bacterium]